MHSYIIALIVMLSAAAPQLSAQRVPVLCHVADKRSAPVAYAAIQVSSITDSAADHQEGITDSIGQVTFRLQQGGKYRARIFSINYLPAMKDFTVTKSGQQVTITADDAPNTLKSVSVTAKTPLFRESFDVTIVNPDALAESSTSAYDIMEEIPGLVVDQDGNIYITSTTPAKVYINGREQKIGNAEIAAILKSLPPGSIEKIEIMRTPSARYDASGSGGIVNVILKKGVRIGLSGSASAGMNQGVYGNQFIGGLINNSNGDFTTSFNVQVNNRNNGERLRTDRILSGDSLFSQNAYTTYPGQSVYGSYNIGYARGDKWDFNYEGRIIVNENETHSSSPAAIISAAEDTAVAYNTGLNNNTTTTTITQGLTAHLKIDTSGSEWTTDASWSHTPTTGTQAYDTRYTIPQPGLLSGNGNITTGFHYLTLRSDLTLKLPARTMMETGIKSTAVWFHSNTNFNTIINGTVYNDPSRTNAYRYREHIYAAYLQAARPFGKIMLKAGLRAENTNMVGQQTIPADTGFSIHRTDLFPYIYVSRKVMSIAGYELRSYLIYRRSITRPAFSNLNPFPRYVDQYVSEVGNPSLRPQFTTNYEANVSVDDLPLIVVGYNDMTDMFSQVIYQAADNSRLTYRTYDNLGTNKELYLKALGAIPPGKVYFFMLGGQYNYNMYEGYYNGRPLSWSRGSWTFFTYHTLDLGPNTQIVLNGFMRYRGQLQFYELSTFGSFNMSINRQFFDKKLKVTLSVADMFFTNNNEFSIHQADIMATGLRKGDTRRFGLNIRYNFGMRKKEESGFLNTGQGEGSNGF